MGSNKSIKIAATSEQLAAEYQAGATIRELATKYGCSFQNINIRIQNAGVVMRSVGQRLLPNRICPTCGALFRPYSRTQRFCRAECIRKKDVCVRGHALTEDNRYHYPSSNARCRRCQAIRSAAYRARKKASA